MNWTESMSNALDYIEKNICDDLKAEKIAEQAYVSSFYFQKGFKHALRLYIK